jgi:signal transduction histidine kinase
MNVREAEPASRQAETSSGVSNDRTVTAIREARSRLSAALAANPSQQAVLAPVLQALAAAESKAAGADGASAASAGADAASAALPESALREQIAKLEEALRARDEFISTVGHELKNPLSPVFMHAEQLLTIARAAPDGLVPADQILPRIESFTHRFRKFLQTLNRILDVSRINTGHVELKLEDVDLVDVIRSVASDMERERFASQSDLLLHAHGPVIGRWDRLRLEQIFANLLSNAIVVGTEDTRAILKVRDQGIGIPADEQERIFYRLERGASGRTTGGFGIGLWVVKRLATALGGDVSVESKVGEGATFTVEVPTDLGRRA